MTIRNSFIGIRVVGRPTLVGVAALLFLVSACGKDRAPAGAAGQPAAASGTTALVAMQPDSVRANPRAQIFLTKGCPQCHKISKLGVVAQIEAGPDLALAYEDVRSRFNTSLDSFLAAPTGTMQIVLSSQIRLSPTERDSIYRLLRDLYQNR
jgi:hypothetical protein